MPNIASFALLAAFTSSPFGGDPAAIVFLDPSKTPVDILQGLARNFNQPMVAFIKPPTADSLVSHAIRTSIRFLMHSGAEVPLCGHASLCAAAAILALPEFKELKVGLVEFETFMNPRIIPVRVLEGGQLELGLPAAPPVQPSKEERQRIESFVQQAFGGEVEVKETLVGPQGFEYALLVEIDAESGLATANVDMTVFARCGYEQNIITSHPSPSSASHDGAEYVYRVFSLHVPGGEDPVCGSAHCLLAPYWHDKKRLEKGREFTAVAASSRGGIVQAVLAKNTMDEVADAVLLKGTTAFLGKGECYF